MAKRRPRGTGHLYRPKTRGREQAVWWLAYHAGGKLVRESTRTTVKTDAEKLLRARTAAVDKGEIADPATLRTTIADLATLVQTDYKNNDRRSGREVARSFERLSEHFGASFLARKIDDAAVERYKAARLALGARNGTINLELAQLRRGLRLAVRQKKVTTLPTFSLLRPGRPRAGFLEPDEFATIVARLSVDLQPLATFMYWTGWRDGEVKGLQWRMVDRKAGVIRIESSKNDEPRTIPYAALPALRDVIDSQWERTKAIERKTGQIIAPVFHRDGRRIRAYLGAWHSACAKAGLSGRIPHDCRRSAARNMTRAGIPQSVAMAIGGWKTASVFKRYAIVDEKLIAENLTKLNALRP
jgi:integrase